MMGTFITFKLRAYSQSKSGVRSELRKWVVDHGPLCTQCIEVCCSGLLLALLIDVYMWSTELALKYPVLLASRL